MCRFFTCKTSPEKFVIVTTYFPCALNFTVTSVFAGFGITEISELISASSLCVDFVRTVIVFELAEPLLEESTARTR